MDKVRAFIDEIMGLYECKDWDETILRSYELIGFDWIESKINDWDWKAAESSEFEMRSALEFLRPELSLFQLEILEKWDEQYKEWRDEGIFFERYATAEITPKWSWQAERESAEKTLGRIIPKSHWWYWPPDEHKKG